MYGEVFHPAVIPQPPFIQSYIHIALCLFFSIFCLNVCVPQLFKQVPFFPKTMQLIRTGKFQVWVLGFFILIFWDSCISQVFLILGFWVPDVLDPRVFSDIRFSGILGLWAQVFFESEILGSQVFWMLIFGGRSSGFQG